MSLDVTPLKFHKCTSDEIIKLGKAAESTVKPANSENYNCLDKG